MIYMVIPIPSNNKEFLSDILIKLGVDKNTFTDAESDNPNFGFKIKDYYFSLSFYSLFFTIYISKDSDFKSSVEMQTFSGKYDYLKLIELIKEYQSL